MESGSRFISVEKAINLIESHTKEEPVVDFRFLADNVGRIRTARNFTIKLVSKDKDGKVSHLAPVFVGIVNDYEKENLRHAIVKKYTELTGKEIEVAAIGLKSISSISDRKSSVRPRAEATMRTKLGETLHSGSHNIQE